jgi:hypothetical protein
MTHPTDTDAAFAHASFMANPDMVAEREIWREVTEELSRRRRSSRLWALPPGSSPVRPSPMP